MPADLSGVTAIAAGGRHSLALRADGTVTAWGNNTYGQATVPPDLAGVTAIAAGQYHSLAIAPAADVDTTPPALAPTLSPNLGGMLVAFGAVVEASANATDDESGIASQTCDPVDTSTAGAHTLTCTATDLAGNITEVTVDYTVGFSVTKLSPPLKAKFKAGSSIPVKFTLTGAEGQPITAALAAQITADCGVTVALNIQAPVCATYDAAKDIFIATLRSPKSLSIGSTVPITITVTLDTTVIATGSTTITVVK